jgi:hypothetical protein
MLAASTAGVAGWMSTAGPSAAPGVTAPALDSTTISWSRKVPVRYEADVAVIGGGIAGVSAACAAARSGARVVLVERFAVTGGDLTVGGVANFCGETKGQGEVFDEILADLDRFHVLAPYRGANTRVFDHHILALVLQELLPASGAQALALRRLRSADRHS